jgi:hypothetical protein
VGSIPAPYSDAPHADTGIAHVNGASPRRWISAAARVGEGISRLLARRLLRSASDHESRNERHILVQ